ncbi:MAG: PTS sugar transporter subunit IIC [Deltaproteobacteria bacterium]|nr:PTS sugar transporter subunit IIC [Deltaproteobacteria bacterium]MBN2671165.1 PTS sugar transporter subunit IIC [Deltaproteobacteria bacterium]
MVQIVTIVAVVFILGAILLLERRCLGKTALVQPLVLCLLAGIISGEETTGIWLGISLQLLSIGQGHYCNWVYASIAASGAFVVLGLYDVRFGPGTLASIALVLVSILLGIISDSAERRLLRGENAAPPDAELWRSEQGVEAFASLIYRRVLRGFLLGGVQSVLGVALATGLAYVVAEKTIIQLNPLMPVAVAIAIPIFGVAVTLGSLSGRAYPFYAGIGVLFSMGVWAII